MRNGETTCLRRRNLRQSGSGIVPVPGARQYGFTYIGLLIAVAILGATLATAGEVWHTAQQRDRERELLFAGDQIRQAIANYYKAGGQYPQNLDDLLRDPRLPSVVRYLRKHYYDPITGTADWGLVKAPGDRIMGVYSLSEEQPIKQANFRWVDRDFADRKKYSEWTFVYQPRPSRFTPPKEPSAPAGTSVTEPGTKP